MKRLCPHIVAAGLALACETAPDAAPPPLPPTAGPLGQPCEAGAISVGLESTGGPDAVPQWLSDGASMLLGIRTRNGPMLPLHLCWCAPEWTTNDRADVTASLTDSATGTPLARIKFKRRPAPLSEQFRGWVEVSQFWLLLAEPVDRTYPMEVRLDVSVSRSGDKDAVVASESLAGTLVRGELPW